MDDGDVSSFHRLAEKCKYRTVLVLTDNETAVLSVLNASRVTPAKYF